MSLGSRTTKLLIAAMSKQLPPSASALRLLDVEGAAGDVLRESRADLAITVVHGDPAGWVFEAGMFDAVTAFDPPDDPPFLAAVLRALRPGGRLIMVSADERSSENAGRVLEEAGYTRILVETGIECPLPVGTLMRGEKPHTTEDTLERVKVAAEHDANHLDWQTYNGRYLFLLIRQTPHKPAWTITPDEVITWHAVTLNGALVAFSSLPKAVAFLQPIVLNRRIDGVTRVTKFSRETGQTWTLPILMNPSPDAVASQFIGWHMVDPKTAEASDE